MAQNVYDDPAFFAGYSDFPRSRLGLIGTAEWPSFRALLPAIAGKRAVELGCGFGHLARWLAGEGARSVLALDLSEKMLSEARAATEDAAVEYRRADLDTLVLEPQSTDLVVSSMTLHYVADFERIARMLRAALVPGGDLVFSVEHPVYSARAVPEWVRADDGRGPADGAGAGVVPIEQHGNGLAGLRERAAAVGAAVTVCRRDGGGFVLRVGW